ncbi:MAG TPA: hypothetical protein VGD77_07415 [Gemmatimonadaceae bacterium]
MTTSQVLTFTAAAREDHRALSSPVLDDAVVMQWLTAGSAVWHASRVSSRAPEDAVTALTRLGEHPVIAAVTGAPDADPSLDSTSHARTIQRARALAEQAEDVGATHLAQSVLDSLAWMVDVATEPRAAAALGDAAARAEMFLERGRTEAQLARIAWKLGHMEEATTRYERVLSEGRRLGSGELRTRYYVGQSVMSQVRGDFPAMRRAALRAVQLGREAGCETLAALGHHALLIVTAMDGRWSEATLHAWAAYESVRGTASLEAERLNAMAQLMMEMGRPADALAGFRAALARVAPVRVTIPALGGVAMASGLLGDLEEVRRMELQLRDLLEYSLPFPVSDALADVATGYHALGAPADAQRAATESRRLAARHDFASVLARLHALATTPVAAPRPMPLTRRAEAVVLAMRRLAA